MQETPLKPKQIYKMRVAEIKDYTPRIRELFLTCEEPTQFSFRAGQFVMLHVPTGEAKPVLRAYSIASDDRIKEGFRLLFNYVDGGVASQFVWALKSGAVLNFTGPFGKLFFKEPPTEQIIMLNTGSGVSQHVCYLASLTEKYPDLKYRLLFGVRTEKDMYYRPELEALQTQFKNFQFSYVLSRPSAGWSGKKGYVQNFISEFSYMNVPTTFYLCGNSRMIKDTKALLAAQNFDSKLIFAEAFD